MSGKTWSSVSHDYFLYISSLGCLNSFYTSTFYGFKFRFPGIPTESEEKCQAFKISENIRRVKKKKSLRINIFNAYRSIFDVDNVSCK